MARKKYNIRHLWHKRNHRVGREFMFYWTYKDFDFNGLSKFKEDAILTLYSDHTWPVAKVPMAHSEEDLSVIFSSDLLKAIIEETDKMAKPVEVALKYGYRGRSAGKKNGIFLQRKQDVNLKKYTDKLIPKYQGYIDEYIGTDYKYIKVVYHDTSGERLVGIMNTEEKIALLLGFGMY